MLRHYESVEMSNQVTYAKVIKPSFTAGPGTGCNHMLNALQKACRTGTEDTQKGTQAQTHTNGQKSHGFVLSNEFI